MTDSFAIDLDGCRSRQRRLVAKLEKLQLEAVILTRPESVQWLTGAWVPPFFTAIASINRDCQTTLIVPTAVASQQFAADTTVNYEAQYLATIRDEQQEASAQVFLDSLGEMPRRVGAEFGYLGKHLTDSCQAEWTDIGDVVLRLRRRKDPDELRMLVRANEANRRMYEHARQMIRPGINELEVYSQLSTVATEELGEVLTYFGQDFQCCSPGGAPRDREAQEGELYILDLGVGFRGYRSDNCRTFCVGREPSDLQQQAWNQLAEVFPLVESTVRPGTSCKSLYERVNGMLEACAPWVFGHHLGHGVGLAGHEGPRLNSHWDDTFEEGNFFTVEPGLYHEQLRHGLRLEQNYLVTSDGVQLLTDWPLELS